MPRQIVPQPAAPDALPSPLDLVGLPELMRRGAGRSEIRIGLIDGPVAIDHPALTGSRLEPVTAAAICSTDGLACAHGTFVAGMLSARRDSAAPSLCPGCTLLIRPIFVEPDGESGDLRMPAATPAELAVAVHDCLAAGARLLNHSAALLRPALQAERALNDAFDAAMRQGALIVVAAGNQGSLGGTAITRHPWAIPVTACDRRGWPSAYANLSHSIGRRGLRAPGEGIASLTPAGAAVVSGGTSVAAPLVTGTVALMWSEFPDASAMQIRLALARAHPSRGMVPPLLDAGAAWRQLAVIMGVSA